MKFLPLPTLRTALAALCLAAAAPSARAESVVIDGVEWRYSLDEAGNAIIGVAMGFSGPLVIPAELDGHPVTELQGDSFSSAFGTIDPSVTIPDSVKKIGDEAFKGQTNLVTVRLGSGVEHIYLGLLFSSAFDGCSSLTEFVVDAGNATYSAVDGLLYSKDGKTLAFYPPGKGAAFTVPNGTETIGASAFANCYTLVSVAMPDSVKTIGEEAFRDCGNLTSVTFGNGLTTIEDDAFDSCEALVSVVLPDSLETMGRQVFRQCTSLVSAEIGSGLKNFGYEAFVDCTNLATVTFSDGVTTIGDHAFSRCRRLVSVSLPDSVVKIEEGAFSSCSALSSVHLGSGLSAIQGDAFYNCGSLERFDLDPGNPNFAAVDGIIFSKDLKKLVVYPPGRRGTCEVPAGTETIGDDAFSGCPGLTGVILPTSVTSIGRSAFYGNDNVLAMTLPESVTSIGQQAFDYNPNLIVLEVPASWEGTDILEDARVPETCVVAYGGLAWEWEEGADGNATITGGPTGAEGLTGLLVPESVGGKTVTAVGMMAFQGRTELVKAMLPDTVTNVQLMAFAGCDALASVQLGAGVRSLDTWVFQDCTSLTNVALPEGLAAIGASAFTGCTGLERIALPDSLRTIDDGAFSWCERLEAVDIPSGVGKIGNGAFSGCARLEQVTLHDGLLVIGDSAFGGCESLYTLRIPDSVMLVGESAFYNSALAALSVPGSWRGGSQLASAEVPEGCAVLYRGLAPDDPRYAAWAGEYRLAPDDLPAEDDPDGDGFSNWDEFIAGTCPSDGDDYLYIGIAVLDGKVQIESYAPSGRKYTFQGTADLAAGESGWSDLTDADLSDLAATPYRSFRVMAEYPEETP